MKLVVKCSECEWESFQNLKLSKKKDPIRTLATHNPGKCPVCDSKLILEPLRIELTQK